VTEAGGLRVHVTDAEGKSVLRFDTADASRESQGPRWE